MGNHEEEQLKLEIKHIFDSGANEIRIFEMVKSFINNNKTVKTIPYQCCPVCNGHGQVLADVFTSSVYQTCKVCNGAMIIPEYVKTNS